MVSNFYGTEIDKWAGIGLVGSVKRMIMSNFSMLSWAIKTHTQKKNTKKLHIISLIKFSLRLKLGCMYKHNQLCLGLVEV